MEVHSCFSERCLAGLSADRQFTEKNTELFLTGSVCNPLSQPISHSYVIPTSADRDVITYNDILLLIFEHASSDIDRVFIKGNSRYNHKKTDCLPEASHLLPLYGEVTSCSLYLP